MSCNKICPCNKNYIITLRIQALSLVDSMINWRTHRNLNT